MKRATVLAAAIFTASPILAQTLDDIAAAEAALAAARQLVAQADENLMKVWEATPLTFRNVAFTVGDPEGFRRYTPRTDSSFRAGELLITYAEVVGYGWRENKDGSFTVAFDIDYVVKERLSRQMTNLPTSKFRRSRAIATSISRLSWRTAERSPAITHWNTAFGTSMKAKPAQFRCHFQLSSKCQTASKTNPQSASKICMPIHAPTSAGFF